MLGIEINGLVDVTSAFEDMSKSDVLEQIMEETANNAKKYAMEYSPVDTGELKSSIDTITYQDGFYLYADTDYAIFNEYGSIYTPIGKVFAPIPAKYQGFRPFLRPAVYKATGEVEYLFGEKYIDRFFEGL